MQYVYTTAKADSRWGYEPLTTTIYNTHKEAVKALSVDVRMGRKHLDSNFISYECNAYEDETVIKCDNGVKYKYTIMSVFHWGMLKIAFYALEMLCAVLGSSCIMVLWLYLMHLSV